MSGDISSYGIILSSAYLVPGLVAEFGRLPSSFLSLANRRLYKWQVESLKPLTSNGLLMTLPEGYVLEAFDKVWLAENNVSTHFLKAQSSLGEVLADVLKVIPEEVEELWILFGDTYISNIASLPPDTLAVGHVQEHSNWGYCLQYESGQIKIVESVDSNSSGTRPVVCGAFRLNKKRFACCLPEADNDFYAALGLYSTKHRLDPFVVGKSWFDFGHLHTYFRSRQAFTTERSFNAIKMENRKVSKFSGDMAKMLAESAWFEQVPRDLSVFLPNYLGRVRKENMAGYAMEYLYLTPVNDLFVHGKLPQYVWEQILTACKSFMETCADFPPKEELESDLNWLYGQKTKKRLKDFASVRGLSLDKPWVFNGRPMPCLNDIFAQVLQAVQTASPDKICVIHGDFHFANIFFDFRSLGIKMVDPRGLIKDIPTIYGDSRYDLAKLSHSITGLYDYIIAGILRASMPKAYELVFEVPVIDQAERVAKVFTPMTFNGLSPNDPEIKAIVILLFLSMLPLHADKPERQTTLLANVFRLYDDFIS
ncbi:MAG: hypothetical protein AB7E52_01300 [Bdellovibrionales bacterium]